MKKHHNNRPKRTDKSRKRDGRIAKKFIRKRGRVYVKNGLTTYTRSPEARFWKAIRHVRKIIWRLGFSPYLPAERRREEQQRQGRQRFMEILKYGPHRAPKRKEYQTPDIPTPNKRRKNWR